MKLQAIIAAGMLLAGGAAGAREPVPVNPASEPGSWVTADDYPADALKNSITGTVYFKLTVGTDGAPTKCDIATSSGSDVLDKQTCSLVMQRAYFEPALDAAGKAVESRYLNRVRWILPEMPGPQPAGFEIAFTVGPDGKVFDCAVTNVRGAPAAAEKNIMEGCAKQTYVPYRDDKGEAVARRVVMRMSVTVEPVVAVPAK